MNIKKHQATKKLITSSNKSETVKHAIFNVPKTNIVNNKYQAMPLSFRNSTRYFNQPLSPINKIDKLGISSINNLQQSIAQKQSNDIVNDKNQVKQNIVRQQDKENLEWSESAQSERKRLTARPMQSQSYANLNSQLCMKSPNQHKQNLRNSIKRHNIFVPQRLDSNNQNVNNNLIKPRFQFSTSTIEVENLSSQDTQNYASQNQQQLHCQTDYTICFNADDQDENHAVLIPIFPQLKIKVSNDDSLGSTPQQVLSFNYENILSRESSNLNIPTNPIQSEHSNGKLNTVKLTNFKLNNLFNNENFIENLVKYLDMKSCITLTGTAKQFRSPIYRKFIKKQFLYLLIKGYLPRSVRPKFWQHFAKTQQIKGIYCEFSYEQQRSIKSEFERDIEKDVYRTYPNVKYFQNEKSKIALKNILCSIASQFPEIGYCQGLNFVTANILQYADEEDTYYIMLALLCNYNFKDFFTEGMKGLHIATEIMDHLIKIFFPDFSDFLQKKNIGSNLFATPWFSTLFSYDFNKYFMTRVMDLFIFCGWKIIFQLGLAIIKDVKSRVIKLEDDVQIADIIRRYPKYISEDKLLFTCQEFKITNRMLASLYEILSEKKNIKHLNINYDLQSKKKIWNYELENELNPLLQSEVNNQIRKRLNNQQGLQHNQQQGKPQKSNGDKTFFNYIAGIFSQGNICGTFCGQDRQGYAFDYEIINQQKRKNTFLLKSINGGKNFLQQLDYEDEDQDYLSTQNDLKQGSNQDIQIQINKINQ